MNNSKNILTPKQKRFYETVKSFIKKHRKSPTVTELTKLLKLSSPRAVTQYLNSLEKKGLITRGRYQRRGIQVVNLGKIEQSDIVTIPVVSSAGCDNVAVFAQRNFGDYVCVSSDLLRGRQKENVIGIKAIGDSMFDAGINEGDYVLIELTRDIQENDLVAAIIDSFAVIKKIEFANNALILKPVSSDPLYKPIIVRRDFQIVGKVIDVIRFPQKGEIEIVPVYPSQ